MNKVNLRKIHVLYTGLFSFVFFPLITFAAPANFKDVVLIVVNILAAILPVIVSLTVIYFLWGLTQYLKADKDKQSEAKTIMMNGIIAFFIMISVWGLVFILTETFIGLGDKGVNVPAEVFNWTWD